MNIITFIIFLLKLAYFLPSWLHFHPTIRPVFLLSLWFDISTLISKMCTLSHSLTRAITQIFAYRCSLSIMYSSPGVLYFFVSPSSRPVMYPLKKKVSVLVGDLGLQNLCALFCNLFLVFLAPTQRMRLECLHLTKV